MILRHRDSPPYISHIDVANVDAIAAKGVDVGPPYAQAQRLVKRSDFLRAWRAIEWALWSQPFLTGEEVELVVAQDKEIAYERER